MNWKKTFAVIRREYVERVRTKVVLDRRRC